MKVFIRSSDLTGEKPRVIAFYPDGSDVPDNAHGDGITVLNLPMSVLVREAYDPVPVLAEDWRARAGSLVVEAEAKRRIDEALPLSEQIGALREMISFIVQYGVNVSEWPAAATARKAELDELWNYIDEIRERARAHMPAIPPNPVSDKVWPRRLAKKTR
jgi:hypothetical protein